jgi:glycosyltransferase involved in cell wall biosynthesis
MDRKNRKRKVLLVVRWPVGGIRTFLKYVLTRFPSSDYNFTFIGADAENTEALREDLSAVVSEWFFFPSDGHQLKSCTKLVWQALRSKEIDLVHAHGFTSAVGCIVPAKLFRVPVVCTSHDVLLADQLVGWQGILKKIVLTAALSQCELVQSVSVDAQSNLSSMLPRLPTRKLTVILNGVNTSAFHSAVPRDLRVECSLTVQTAVVGFFGRFMGQKGFGLLVDAIEKLRNHDEPNRQIHVVCFGSGAFIREEIADIQRRGLSDSFTFVPFTADISGAMKGCDLVAMPSRWEACGLVAMEALSAGVPFVGSNCIGLREVLDGTPAIVVQAGSSDSLAQGIVDGLNRDRQSFVDYAPKAVERFDVAKTAQQINQMYERVLG